MIRIRNRIHYSRKWIRRIKMKWIRNTDILLIFLERNFLGGGGYIFFLNNEKDIPLSLQAVIRIFNILSALFKFWHKKFRPNCGFISVWMKVIQVCLCPSNQPILAIKTHFISFLEFLSFSKFISFFVCSQYSKKSSGDR